MSQTSYYTCNDQPILLSHRYPSPPKLDGTLPSLSHLLTSDNNSNNANINNNNNTNNTNNTTQIKNEPLASGEGYYSIQSPSTILVNTDTPLATSVDLFDSVTTADTTGYVLTSVPLSTVSAAAATHPLQNTPSLYMEDPVTAAATAATMIYGPTMLPSTTTTAIINSTTSSPSTLSLSSTSSPMNPLLLSTTTIVTPNAGLDTVPVPCFYPSAPPPYNYDNMTRSRQASISSNSSSSDKVYSFVAIPGMDQKKRPRRRYDEIERLYHCTFSDCKKSYGTLNHLNSHVLMQNHGPKRHPSEFKEMRKEWRRQRKQREQQKKQVEKVNHEQQQQPQPTLTTAFHPPSFIPTNFPLQSMPLPGFY